MEDLDGDVLDVVYGGAVWVDFPVADEGEGEWLGGEKGGGQGD